MIDEYIENTDEYLRCEWSSLGDGSFENVPEIVKYAMWGFRRESGTRRIFQTNHLPHYLMLKGRCREANVAYMIMHIKKALITSRLLLGTETYRLAVGKATKDLERTTPDCVLYPSSSSELLATWIESYGKEAQSGKFKDWEPDEILGCAILSIAAHAAFKKSDDVAQVYDQWLEKLPGHLSKVRRMRETKLKYLSSSEREYLCGDATCGILLAYLLSGNEEGMWREFEAIWPRWSGRRAGSIRRKLEAKEFAAADVEGRLAMMRAWKELKSGSRSAAGTLKAAFEQWSINEYTDGKEWQECCSVWESFILYKLIQLDCGMVDGKERNLYGYLWSYFAAIPLGRRLLVEHGIEPIACDAPDILSICEMFDEERAALDRWRFGY